MLVEKVECKVILKVKNQLTNLKNQKYDVEDLNNLLAHNLLCYSC